MPITCPNGFDVVQLQQRVQATYERVALAPGGGFHFHTGRGYAVELLRYDRAELEALPRLATDRFAGVGNPLRIGPVPRGAVVLDHACGAGTDLLLAVKRGGAGARGIGVDLTPAMLACAAAAAAVADLSARVELHRAGFEALPLAAAAVDLALSNGVLNLAPDKPAVLRELARVLRPGGCLYLADVVVERELTAAARGDPDLWAACVGGALTEAELIGAALLAGFEDVHIVERFDCFRRTSVERKFGRALRVGAVNLFARKPD
jgi:SAM-dependent methyltransferase